MNLLRPGPMWLTFCLSSSACSSADANGTAGTGTVTPDQGASGATANDDSTGASDTTSGGTEAGRATNGGTTAAGGTATGKDSTSGGAMGTGGATTGGTSAAGGATTGGDSAAGGLTESSGATSGSSTIAGGAATGGSSAAGGTATGGATAAGGATAGSATNTGGTGTGGATGNATHIIGDGPISIDGRQILVDRAPIHLQGICWNPVPEGGNHPADLDYAGFVGTDAPLMATAGINVVRTYEPIADLAVLDTLHAAGIKVLMSIYVYGGDDPSVSTARVDAVKEHPAVLMWLVGNEWNYNGLYVDLSFDESLARLQTAATLIKEADPSRPVATVYGEIPSADTVSALSAVDVWGINSYRGISFGTLFDEWASVGTQPMFLAEWGADAYDARDGGAPNLTAQAEATTALATEIATHKAARGGVCSGGTLFEWADEWWKDAAGDPNVQDIGGIAPGGGPYPDQTFNEEWWGIVTIDRQTRPAYDALSTVYLAP